MSCHVMSCHMTILQTIPRGVWAGCCVPHINQDRGLYLRYSVQYSTVQYSTVYLRGGPHYLAAKTEADTIRNHQHMVMGLYCWETLYIV